MIELHVEALFEFVGKSFQRRIVAADIRVADRAHGHVWRRELREMTSGAFFVTGEAGPRGIVRSMMTV
jgi:hypothetical protein